LTKTRPPHNPLGNDKQNSRQYLNLAAKSGSLRKLLVGGQKGHA
jgi:hypothetical protein